jgi:hypothetical protein
MKHRLEAVARLKKRALQQNESTRDIALIVQRAVATNRINELLVQAMASRVPLPLTVPASQLMFNNWVVDASTMSKAIGAEILQLLANGIQMRLSAVQSVVGAGNVEDAIDSAALAIQEMVADTNIVTKVRASLENIKGSKGLTEQMAKTMLTDVERVITIAATMAYAMEAPDSLRNIINSTRPSSVAHAFQLYDQSCKLLEQSDTANVATIFAHVLTAGASDVVAQLMRYYQAITKTSAVAENSMLRLFSEIQNYDVATANFSEIDNSQVFQVDKVRDLLPDSFVNSLQYELASNVAYRPVRVTADAVKGSFTGLVIAFLSLREYREPSLVDGGTSIRSTLHGAGIVTAGIAHFSQEDVQGIQSAHSIYRRIYSLVMLRMLADNMLYTAADELVHPIATLPYMNRVAQEAIGQSIARYGAALYIQQAAHAIAVNSLEAIIHATIPSLSEEDIKRVIPRNRRADFQAWYNSTPGMYHPIIEELIRDLRQKAVIGAKDIDVYPYFAEFAPSFYNLTSATADRQQIIDMIGQSPAITLLSHWSRILTLSATQTEITRVAITHPLYYSNSFIGPFGTRLSLASSVPKGGVYDIDDAITGVRTTLFDEHLGLVEDATGSARPTLAPGALLELRRQLRSKLHPSADVGQAYVRIVRGLPDTEAVRRALNVLYKDQGFADSCAWLSATSSTHSSPLLAFGSQFMELDPRVLTDHEHLVISAGAATLNIFPKSVADLFAGLLVREPLAAIPGRTLADTLLIHFGVSPSMSISALRTNHFLRRFFANIDSATNVASLTTYEAAYYRIPALEDLFQSDIILSVPADRIEDLLTYYAVGSRFPQLMRLMMSTGMGTQSIDRTELATFNITQYEGARTDILDALISE